MNFLEYYIVKMKKITLKSAHLQNNFRLFRVKVAPEKIQEMKDLIMEKMNEYLEENDGYFFLKEIIKMKILEN